MTRTLRYRAEIKFTFWRAGIQWRNKMAIKYQHIQTSNI